MQTAGILMTLCVCIHSRIYISAYGNSMMIMAQVEKSVMSRLQLVSAGAPELVRSDQKDRFYSSQLASLVSDVVHNLLPLRYVLRWEREFHLLAEVPTTIYTH